MMGTDPEGLQAVPLPLLCGPYAVACGAAAVVVTCLVTPACRDMVSRVLPGGGEGALALRSLLTQMSTVQNSLRVRRVVPQKVQCATSWTPGTLTMAGTRTVTFGAADKTPKRVNAVGTRKMGGMEQQKLRQAGWLLASRSEVDLITNNGAS